MQWPRMTLRWPFMTLKIVCNKSKGTTSSATKNYVQKRFFKKCLKCFKCWKCHFKNIYYRVVQSHPKAGWLWTPPKFTNKKCFNNDRDLLSRVVLDFVGAPILKLWNPSIYVYFLVGIKKTKKSVQSHPFDGVKYTVK